MANLTDAQIRATFDHFQRQIDFQSAVIGLTMGGLIAGDPVMLAEIDHALTKLDGMASRKGLSEQRVIERIRTAADPILAANRVALENKASKPEQQTR